jgi:PAS domain S-box-containing protein
MMRDSGFRHLGALPVMIRKVLNVRESLDRQNAHFQLSERRYLDLVSSLPDIVYTLDGDGNFIYINESVSQLGYSPHELIGKHFSEIIQEDYIPKVSRNIVVDMLKGMVTGDEAAPKLFDERRSGGRMTRILEVRLKSSPMSLKHLGRHGPTLRRSILFGYSLPSMTGSDRDRRHYPGCDGSKGE